MATQVLQRVSHGPASLGVGRFAGEPFVGGMVLCAMVWQHLTLILPSRRCALAMAMGTVFVAGSLVLSANSYQANDRVFSELYVSTLAPPALRLAPAVTTKAFIDGSRPLKAVLDAHAGDDEGTDGSGN